jgi:3alpha(or 20beta)-hydroxysteroid dehydrogenase
MSRLQNKVAIITGAARGQGAAEARLFAAEGASVVLTDLNEAQGSETAAEIGDAAIFVRHDVSNADAWGEVVKIAVERFGGLDILVNNAGVYKPKPFQETDRELLDLHYRVNVLGPFLGMQAVYPIMLNAGGGAIVNIASGAGVRGYPGMFAYAGSKWMLRGLSKCAAVDLAGNKIRINTILPGLIDTPMLAENSKEYFDYITSLPPAKRLGTADEVARAALFLASDDASYVTGAEIAVCGGLIA